MAIRLAPLRQGFSIIEIMIVIAITTILSSYIISYSSSSRHQIAISVEAAKVAQVIARARNLTVAAQFGSFSVCGFGISFDYGNDTYTLVRYEDPVSCASPGPGGTITPIEQFSLAPPVQFNVGNTIDTMIFIAPDPDVFVWDAGGNPLALPLQILLRTTGGTTEAITVEYGGQVTL